MKQLNRLIRGASLLLMAFGLSACLRAPIETLPTDSLTVQVFEDSKDDGELCLLDATDTPIKLSLDLSGVNIAGIEADGQEANILRWQTKYSPKLPITVTASLPSDSPYELGVVDSIVITASTSPAPAFVVRAKTHGTCEGPKRTAQLLAKLDAIRADSEIASANARITLLIVGVLPLVLFGLVWLLKGDWAWSWHEFGQRARGITELTRTDEWETMRILSGIGILICALFLAALVWSF